MNALPQLAGARRNMLKRAAVMDMERYLRMRYLSERVVVYRAI
jgi:hypothetical protein